ncbi:MAG: SpoIIE family protein phosphatase, partial [Bacteroidales bacterium]|nr:SpoIIE family protein phosphatase [Bacteroidales bacterium]
EQRQTERLHHEQTQRMRVVIVSLISGLLMASLLLVFIIRILKIKKRANEQLDAVHTAVIESMHYSQRIQMAVIPSDEFIKSLFPQSFVYYRPRDIVSGDFYYTAKCGRYSVFVVSDCTGHGIPGGFLSMLGISSLKEFLVTEEDAANPGSVLDRMRTFFKEALGSSNDSLMPMYDGMDIIICSFDLENQNLVYASANLRGYIIRCGEVIKLQGDKMPVGRYFVEKEHFQTLSTPLQSGDMVYLCTDGIQDQTGDPDAEHPFGKKFMTSKLITILTDMSPLPLDMQIFTIDGVVTQWRGPFDQIDDITLVGIRI